MIKVAAAVEHYLRDAFFLGPIRNRFADAFGRGNVAAGSAIGLLAFGRGRRRNGDALQVVNQLGVNVVQRSGVPTTFFRMRSCTRCRVTFFEVLVSMKSCPSSFAALLYFAPVLPTFFFKRSPA